MGCPTPLLRFAAPAALLTLCLSFAAVVLGPNAAAAPVAEDEFARQLAVAMSGSKVFQTGTTLVMTSTAYDENGDLVTSSSTVNPDGSLLASVEFTDIRYDFRCTNLTDCWVRSSGRRWQKMKPHAITRTPIELTAEELLAEATPLGAVYDVTQSGDTAMFTQTYPGGLDITRSTFLVTPRHLTMQHVEITEGFLTQAPREDLMGTVTFVSLPTPIRVTAPTALRPGQPVPSSYSVLTNPGGAS